MIEKYIKKVLIIILAISLMLCATGCRRNKYSAGKDIENYLYNKYGQEFEVYDVTGKDFFTSFGDAKAEDANGIKFDIQYFDSGSFKKVTPNDDYQAALYDDKIKDYFKEDMPSSVEMSVSTKGIYNYEVYDNYLDYARGISSLSLRVITTKTDIEYIVDKIAEKAEGIEVHCSIDVVTEDAFSRVGNAWYFTPTHDERIDFGLYYIYKDGTIEDVYNK